MAGGTQLQAGAEPIALQFCGSARQPGRDLSGQSRPQLRWIIQEGNFASGRGSGLRAAVHRAKGSRAEDFGLETEATLSFRLPSCLLLNHGWHDC